MSSTRQASGFDDGLHLQPPAFEQVKEFDLVCGTAKVQRDGQHQALVARRACEEDAIRRE